MACPRCEENSVGSQYCMFCGVELSPNASTSILTTHPPLPVEMDIWADVTDAGIISQIPSKMEGDDSPVSRSNTLPSIHATSLDTENLSSYGDEPSQTWANLWGPFAGYGTRRRHVGWLLNHHGAKAHDLLLKVGEKFDRRSIPATEFDQIVLTAQGLVVQQRRYYRLRRGLVSMMLYISRFGDGLYVSLSSYLKPPLNNLRILIVGGMLTFSILMMLFYAPALQSALLGTFESIVDPFSSGSGSDNLIVLLCVLGPLGLFNNVALFIMGCYSLYKFLTEKDAFAVLRSSPNEFDEDDLMALEKAVEETVRQSLTDLHLNPDELQRTTPQSESVRLF